MAESDSWFDEARATFGDRLTAAREEMGLSQKELAARMGIKLRTVVDWENDLSDPRANKLQMLSGVLNVSIPWLLTGEGKGPGAPLAPMPADAERILREMRALRIRIGELTAELGDLEAQLRSALQ